jgi:hypothetical protein
MLENEVLDRGRSDPVIEALYKKINRLKNKLGVVNTEQHKFAFNMLKDKDKKQINENKNTRCLDSRN